MISAHIGNIAANNAAQLSQGEIISVNWLLCYGFFETIVHCTQTTNTRPVYLNGIHFVKYLFSLRKKFSQINVFNFLCDTLYFYSQSDPPVCSRLIQTFEGDYIKPFEVLGRRKNWNKKKNIATKWNCPS